MPRKVAAVLLSLGSMPRRIPALALIFLASCGVSLRKGPKATIGYAHFQSLQEGIAAEKILDGFGEPADILREKGKIAGLTYWCEDARGRPRQLRMVFSPDERLTKWILTDS